MLRFSSEKRGLGYIGTSRGFVIISVVSVFALFAIIIQALMPISIKLDQASATTGEPNPSETSIAMTTGHEGANVKLVLGGGTSVFATSDESGQAEFGVSTNNYTGYTLLIFGNDDAGQLINAEAGSTLDSITTAIDAEDFGDRDKTIYNNRWGYRPSKLDSLPNNKFLPSPTTDQTIIDVTDQPNSTPNTYTIGLGARVDYSKPGGTYKNTIIVSAVGNAVAYNIAFADNTGDSTVKDLPSSLSSSTEKTSVKLPADTPTRTGYVFSKWCQGTVSENGTVCNGTEYSADSDFGIDQTTSNVVTLYATWIPDAYDITIKTANGVSKVTLNDTECTSSDGCVVSGLSYGESYPLSVNLIVGFTFSTWNAGNYGTIANPSSESTTYTVGAGNSIITPVVIGNKYDVTIKPTTGIDSISLNGTSCSNTSGCKVVDLQYNTGYSLSANISTGYSFLEFSPGDYGSVSGTTVSGNTATATYTVGADTSTITASATPNNYILNLSNTGATTYGSTSAKVTYDSIAVYDNNTGTSITNPAKAHTVSGFSTSYNNASGASVSSTSTKTSNYDFNGWYTASSGGSRIITTSGALVANTSYTDSYGRWVSTSSPTLYAQWGSGSSITLPTITKDNYTCGWTTSTSTTTVEYASGYNGLVPTSDMVLYGVCTPEGSVYTLTLNNYNATSSGSTFARVTYGSSTVYGGTSGTSGISNPSRYYTASGFSTSYNNASGASVSSTSTKYYTYSFDGWYTSSSGGSRIITSSGTLVANTSYTNSNGQWISTSSPTLYSQWSGGSSITLPTISKTGYTCGWTTSTNTSTISYSSGYSGLTLTDNMTLYGVCTPTTYTLTLNNYDATSSGSSYARVTYGSSTVYGGTSGTSGISSPSRYYTASGFSTSYNNASGASVSSTSTKYYYYDFNGWYTSSSGGSRIITSSGSLVANTSYTNSYGEWSSTSTPTLYSQWSSGSSITLPTITKSGYTCGWSTSTNTSTITYSSGYSGLTLSSNITLYGVCKADATVYTLSLNNYNATSYGSTSARVTYGSSTVYGGTSGTSGISNPSRSYSVSGFSTSYNNASGASVSSTSTKYYTYSFDGWYTSSSGGSRIITSSGSLVANTSYTNSYGQWSSTSTPTLYSQWSSGSSITLPTITKSGHTCGWTTSTNTTSITYSSGYSGLTLTSDMTLYGVCVASTYSLTINFSGSGVSSVQVRTSSGTGGSLMGTVSSSGGSVSGLASGTSYYLYPSFTSGYELDSWSNTGSYGSLSSTSSSNPYFTMGAGNGTVRITGKASASATTMQDFTKAMCEAQASSTWVTLTDSRDQNEYEVRYFDGNCWMVDNLRFTGTSISSSDTNINTSKTLSWSTLGSGTSTTVAKNRSGTDGNGDPTVWYNYAGATALTITGSSNSTNASYSICPKGWRLPTSSELKGNIKTSISDNENPFRITDGGGYYAGSTYTQSDTAAGWWSSDASTASSSTNRDVLGRGLSGGTTKEIVRKARTNGYYIRCVRSS